MLLPQFTPVSKISDRDTKRAELLHQVIFKKYASRAAWRKSAWADEFRKLDQDVGCDRVNAVLDFFIHHEGEVGIVISSATAFRKFFLVLEEKAKKGRSAVTESELTSTAKATLPEVKRRTSRLIWPEDCISEVDDFTILSLVNYDEFFHRLKAVYLSLPESHENYRIVKCVWDKCDNPLNATVQWIEVTHNLVHNWVSWSGSLRGLHFSATNQHFKKIIREWIDSYTRKYEDGTAFILNLLGYIP